MIRAVLDSSVLVSAFLTVTGTSHEVLNAARHGIFVLCLSREIIEETRRSLRDKVKTIRRHYTYSDKRIDAYIADLIALAEPVTDLPELAVVPLDPEDNVIVATAAKAGASHLVTGDRHLLSLDIHDGIRMATPRQFLDLLDEAADGAGGT